jgi:hypothetical protein
MSAPAYSCLIEPASRPTSTDPDRKNTMTTANRHPAVLQPQVSATVRFVTAVAVATVLALTWIVAEHASHQAVQTATAAISRGAVPASAPVVEIADRRAVPAKRI